VLTKSLFGLGVSSGFDIVSVLCRLGEFVVDGRTS
jgi:hypothetical protein